MISAERMKAGLTAMPNFILARRAFIGTSAHTSSMVAHPCGAEGLPNLFRSSTQRRYRQQRSGVSIGTKKMTAKVSRKADKTSLFGASRPQSWYDWHISRLAENPKYVIAV